MYATLVAYALVAALSQTGAPSNHIRAALLSPASANAIAFQAGNTLAPPLRQTLPAAPSDRRSPALVGLYASFVGLEALDIYSTQRALGNGGVETNPAMRGVVSNSASFIAVKAATGGAVIWMSEKMRKQHPGLAIAMMVGLNSAIATVVAHNYSIR